MMQIQDQVPVVRSFEPAGRARRLTRIGNRVMVPLLLGDSDRRGAARAVRLTPR